MFIISKLLKYVSNKEYTVISNDPDKLDSLYLRSYYRVHNDF